MLKVYDINILQFDTGILFQTRDTVSWKLQTNIKPMIASSPFSRAKETAAITAGEHGVEFIEENENLRERDFGDYEGASSLNYSNIWQADKINSGSKLMNSASVNKVRERAISVINELESLEIGDNKSIFLVAHGDTLSILETYFRTINSNLHPTVPFLMNAEIRGFY